MAIRMLALTGLAVGLAFPASAQQISPTGRQQAEAVLTQYASAVTNGDAAALDALYAPNAIDISPFGKLEDASPRAQHSEKTKEMGLVFQVGKIEDAEPIFDGQGILVTAGYTANFTNEPKIPPGRGYLLAVLERSGQNWKIRAVSTTRLGFPAPPK